MNRPEWLRVELDVVEKYGADTAVVLGLLRFRCSLTGEWSGGVADVVEDTGLTEHRASTALRKLRDAGLASSYRADRFRPHRTWSVSPGQNVDGEFPITYPGNPSVPEAADSQVCSYKEPEELNPKTLEQQLEVEVAAPSRVLAAVPDLPQPDPLEAEFVEFWSRYPRKVGRKPALAAWRRARKVASLEVIAQGLMAQLPDFARREASKIPHAATWLNQERWSDVAEHARQADTGRGRRTNELLNLGGNGQDYIDAMMADQPFPARPAIGARS